MPVGPFGNMPGTPGYQNRTAPNPFTRVQGPTGAEHTARVNAANAPPAPSMPAAPPDLTSLYIVAAMRAQRRKSSQARGYASTFLTGPRGLGSRPRGIVDTGLLAPAPAEFGAPSPPIKTLLGS